MKGTGTYILIYALCLALALGSFFRELQATNWALASWYGTATFLFLVYGLGMMVKLRDEREI